MLDTDTKRRIDTCRDILVGKVPDPKSQVEQITIALIYKFMDDMDSEAAEIGGKRSFFVNAFKKYRWSNLLAPTMGGQETLNLYSEAIGKMTENTHLPELFRDIFKNAYLPYRDPETLRAFLKEIDTFKYDHSERLGDAFEYLLSVLGSQGDAGQFRTPRHIIDFIVAVVNPQKNETILDPACGTAGFLISAWKHILKQNTKHKPGDLLKSDERKKLALNIRGYDISPDMVRLSLVNLYLHGFTDPHIYEYDTLTSEERWNEFYDVILANPPFMSPKGGIKPHKRFSIQAKRSEVLFVDYMAEHLTAKGRAGIIVPEGIIFQSQDAYVALRKMLVENNLVAVVSLPAGCFNPYSGVKTSILILDKAIAKNAKTIAFFKVENDGFGLGAQRRAIEKNDLPQVQGELASYLEAVRSGQPTGELQRTCGLIVAKDKVAANGDYNLSGDRYRDVVATASLSWPLVPLGELCVIERGASPRPIHDFITDAADGVNWIKIGDAEVGAKYISATKERVSPEGAAKSRRVKPGDFILSNSMSFGRPYIMATEGCIHDGWLLLRDRSDRLDQDFLYSILGSVFVAAQFKRAATGGVVNNLNSEIVRGVKIPLPPLNVQKEIVSEIEGYQRVINGARAVIDNYRPRVSLSPECQMVNLGEVCDIRSGGTPSRTEATFWNGAIPWVTTTLIDYNIIYYANEFITQSGLESSSTWIVPKGTVLMAMYGQGVTRGRVAILGIDAAINQACAAFLIKTPSLDSRYLFRILQARYENLRAISEARGGNQSNLSAQVLKKYAIPLPPVGVQRQIVAEIEAEESLVAANRELINRFEQKIQATIAGVWGDEQPGTAKA